MSQNEVMTTDKIRQRDKKPEYADKAYSKVTTMGNIIEVTTLKKKPPAPPVRKLTNDLYEDLRTGEVCEYVHGETRADSVQGVRRTLANIRALVNTNCCIPENVRWVTLTYAENMTDTMRLYEDFKKFWKRFSYWCQKNGHEKPEYISVIEPQGRGAWHVHAFFIWPSKAPFVSNNEVMAKIWEHGFTSTKAIADCDNVGAYFSAYLGDMPLEEVQALPDDLRLKAMDIGSIEVKDFTNDENLVKSKPFVKGARLVLYPAKMNILRYSKGIKQPEIEVTTYEQAKKKVSSAKLTFSRSFDVLSSDGSVCNTICKEQYNTRHSARSNKSVR